MREENVMYFTQKGRRVHKPPERIGTRKNIAKVMVFLAKTPEATSRALERGTDIYQPEVSITMRDLTDRGWVNSRER